jgi:hypothetical protein
VGDDFTEEVTFSKPAPSSGSAIGGNSSGGAMSAEDAYENEKKYGKGGQVAPPMSNGAYGSGQGNLRGSAPAPSSGSFSSGAGTGAFARNRGTAGRGTEGAQQQQQVMQKGRGRELDRYRLQQAEQAESTIAQVCMSRRSVAMVWWSHSMATPISMSAVCGTMRLSESTKLYLCVACTAL